MKYVVYGAGAVGGVIGGLLHQAGHPVMLVARRRPTMSGAGTCSMPSIGTSPGRNDNGPAIPGGMTGPLT